MTEVLHSSCSSSPSSISTPSHDTLYYVAIENDGIEEEVIKKDKGDRNSKELSLLALLVDLFRKSFLMACKTGTDGEVCSCSGGGGGPMEIGWPTNVEHVAHVTFDRFNGFLGLPVEFEPEVPRRAPSASATVFGVSTDSMQLSFDPRGNSVPTILLQMQRRLYDQGGLQAEGIFRITAGNSQEEYVRDQLNRGVVPEGIDVHCLAGLIKAWFRELPRGILDPLSPEQVTGCQSEEHCVQLVRLLPATEAALLDWAINLMADVVLEEHLNKMNPHNIAMVFAPNMTQMGDPLTALMYAVQVMNFLKTLVERALRGRKDCFIETPGTSHLEPTDEDGNQGLPRLHVEDAPDPNTLTDHAFVTEEPDSEETAAEDPDSDTVTDSNQVDDISDEEFISYSTSEESDANGSFGTPDEVYVISEVREASVRKDLKSSYEEHTQRRSQTGQSSNPNQPKVSGKIDTQKNVGRALITDSKCKALGNLTRINSMTKRVESWR